MSFDWATYLQVSDFLNENYQCEASFRSSVSRAYYCAFGRARLFCLSQKYIKHTEKGSKIHQIVIDALQSVDYDPEILGMGNLLASLREKRNEADYDVFSKKMTESYAKIAVEDAREILAIIDEF